ncbi:hypothetical protein GCM10018987_55650 [Streptomyces cremeus]
MSLSRVRPGRPVRVSSPRAQSAVRREPGPPSVADTAAASRAAAPGAPPRCDPPHTPPAMTFPAAAGPPITHTAMDKTAAATEKDRT